jgi:hypothetical protein
MAIALGVGQGAVHIEDDGLQRMGHGVSLVTNLGKAC